MASTGNHYVLKVVCKISHINFLIDSGSCISIVPYKKENGEKKTGLLYAVNNTKIPVYGEEEIEIDLGFDKKFKHNFVKADVNQGIIGADFLSKNGLILDLAKSKIYEENTRSYQTYKKVQSKVSAITMIANKEVEKLIEKYENLFKDSKKLPPIKSDYVHSIPTKGIPPFCRPRRLSPSHLGALRRILTDLIGQDILVPSNAEYASPSHLVQKGNEVRLVGDFRKLIAIIKRDVYPIPHLKDFTAILAGKTRFTNLDIKSAFYHIPVREEDMDKTTITTPLGAYKYKRLPLGLSNAPQSFQRWIDSALRDLHRIDENGNKRQISLFAYIDDILVASEDMKNNILDLDVVLKQ